MAISVGVLEALLKLRDELSPSLAIARRNVNAFAKDNKESFESVGKALGLLGGAAVAAAAGVAALGARGADVKDVADSFDLLTKNAGGGAQSIDTLRTATDGLITNYDLMKTANASFSQGLTLTQDQMRLTGEAARVLADRTGKDVKGAYEVLMQTMATGRDRQLKEVALNIDAAAAVKKYADSLGVESSALNESQQTAAKKQAVLEAMTRVLEESGRAELDFGERITQAKVTMLNFVDSMGVAIATSPVLNAGMKAIGDAIQVAFGTNQANTVKTLIGWIEQFAILLVKAAQVGVTGVSYLVQGFYALKGVFAAVMGGLSDALGIFVDKLADAAEAAAKLPGFLGGDAFKGMAQQLRADSDNLSMLTSGFEAQKREAADGIATTREWEGTINGALGKVVTSMEAAKGKTAETVKGMGEMGPATTEAAAATNQLTESVTKSLREFDQFILAAEKTGTVSTLVRDMGSQIMDAANKAAILGVKLPDSVARTIPLIQASNQGFADLMRTLQAAGNQAAASVDPLKEKLADVATKTADWRAKLEELRPFVSPEMYAAGVAAIEQTEKAMTDSAKAAVAKAQAIEGLKVKEEAEAAVLAAQVQLTGNATMALQLQILQIDQATAAKIRDIQVMMAEKKITEEFGQAAIAAYEQAAEAAKKFAEQQADIGKFNAISQWTDDILGMLDTLANLPQAFASATDSASAFTRALNTAKLGSQVGGQMGKLIGGAVGGPLGAAMGEAIGKTGGAIIGAVVGIFKKPSWIKVGKEAGAVLGEEIGKEMAKKIEQTSKDLGVSTKVAALINLPAVMAESGRTAASFSRPIMDLLNGVADGSIPAVEGVEALGEAFSSLADEARAGSIEASKLVVQMLQTARGTKAATAEMKEFVAEALRGAQEGVKAMIEAGTITSAADAEAQGYIFAATFWATVKEQGLLAAGEAFGEQWQAFKDQLAAAEIDPETLSAITGPIDAVMALFADETTKNIVVGLDGATKAVKGLGDAGFMTEGAFKGLGQQAGSAFEKLKEQGVAAPVALQAIAPALAEIQRQSQLYGFEIDANTQSLIDQAAAAGIAFPTDPLQQVVAILQDIANTIRQINGLPIDIKTNPVQYPNLPEGGPPGMPEYQRGVLIPELPQDMIFKAHRGERLEVTRAQDADKRNMMEMMGSVRFNSSPTFNVTGVDPSDVMMEKLLDKVERNERGTMERLRMMVQNRVA